MAAISAFGVTQRSQILSLFFRNRIQCIALYQLHNSQALLNLRRGYYNLKSANSELIENKYCTNSDASEKNLNKNNPANGLNSDKIAVKKD